jgi:putative phosphoesterase
VRIAIVSDIHGNLTAFEAVLADLRQTSPDLVFHGGDLAHGGPNPAEIVDRIRDLGWSGVLGNTDEMLFDPESLNAFAARAPQLESLWTAIREMAAWDREALGQERLEQLRKLPRRQIVGSMALVHASPDTAWRSPGPEASDSELQSTYGPLGARIAVYGHIHRPHIRALGDLTVVNTGSVSLSYDGDSRASYLLLDDAVPSIRRVEYDVEREMNAVTNRHIPHADWIAKMLRTASPQMP